MAGRDERRGRDPDDWFDEPQPPMTPRVRPNQSQTQADDARDAQHANDEDWLGGDMRPARGPRSGFPGALSERRLAVVVLVALVVLLGLSLALALSGVFSSATPRRAATTTSPTHAKTTTTATSPTQTQTQPSLAAAPPGPLKPGDQGSAVRVLQRALASLGYSPGAVDGNYGTSTQRAVARFQTVSNLTPDGILGPQTLLALGTALKGP